MSVDSQSQSGEPGIQEHGLNGGKKVNGRKRHIAVDTLGLMLICLCTAANTADSVAGQRLVELLNKADHFPRFKKILGDNSYRTVGQDLNLSVTVEAAERAEGQKGFVPEAFRWAVERTLHQESMSYIANFRLCLKRYEKWLAQEV